MNGLLALCHFCELHGPSVIFCTQAFHLHAPEIDEAGVTTDNNTPGDNVDARSFAAVQLSSSLLESTHKISQTTTTTTNTTTAEALKRSVSEAGTTIPKPSVCPSCSSLPEYERGYVTNDYEAKTTYLSTRNPIHPKLYAIVRQACVRSLSCEFSPGREGPVMFGDEQDGYVLSYMFKIRDSQARGMQRWYCFILLMTDRIYLIASWPFLVSNFRRIATDYQQKAERTYDREIQSRRKQETGRFSFATQASDQFLRRRGSQSLRSLSDLMGSPEFFSQVHGSCSWILRSCGNRLFEKQLAGTPLIATSTDIPQHNDAEASDSSKSFLAQYLDTPMGRTFPHLCFDSLLELRKILRADAFSTIVYNTVIGNQVIVRGDVFAVVESILNLLKDLIPPGCCNIITYENVYQESYKCNFLGLHSSAEIPNYVDKATYVLLDIKFDAYDDYVTTGSHNFSNYDQQIEKFRQFYFLVAHGPRSRSTSRRANGSVDFQLSVVTNSFTTQFESLLSLNPSPTLLDVQLMIIKEDWISKTKLFFKFARSPDGENEDKIKKFVKVVVGLKEIDIPVLRFWTTGLDKRHRTKLLLS